MKISSLLLIAVFAAFMGLAYAKNTGDITSLEVPGQVQTKEKEEKTEDAKYAGYFVDGYTSASKLAAQRSHTVAGEDERDFAIFTGITVVLIIYFFTQFNFFGK